MTFSEISGLKKVSMKRSFFFSESIFEIIYIAKFHSPVLNLL